MSYSERIINGAVLKAPESFWTGDYTQYRRICNGAGAAEGMKFPNTFWGLNVKPAFDIHDWEYEKGKTKLDKVDADMNMLENCFSMIDAWTTETPVIGTILRALRRYRATTYYNAVREHGDAAFFKDSE